jgi:hypothetical protein
VPHGQAGKHHAATGTIHSSTLFIFSSSIFFVTSLLSSSPPHNYHLSHYSSLDILSIQSTAQHFTNTTPHQHHHYTNIFTNTTITTSQDFASRLLTFFRIGVPTHDIRTGLWRALMPDNAPLAKGNYSLPRSFFLLSCMLLFSSLPFCILPTSYF